MSEVETRADGTEDFGEATTQYLTFVMADELYAVEILRVQEIKGWQPVTPLPGSPSYVRGVMNLRGTVVPVVDLRSRFGLPEIEHGPTTVVVVLRVYTEDEQTKIIGVVVDGVSDVTRIEDSALSDPPELGQDPARKYAQALATVEERMVIVLNIDAMLAIDEPREAARAR